MMARCGNCGKVILYGGLRYGSEVYCSSDCYEMAPILEVAPLVPADLVDQQVQQAYHGKCPLCGRPGPVELHKSYQVVSLIIAVQWGTYSHVCCSRCARIKVLRDSLVCLLLGWWGVGLFITPIQLVRNVASFVSAGRSFGPSDELRETVRIGIARRWLQEERDLDSSSAGTLNYEALPDLVTCPHCKVRTRLRPRGKSTVPRCDKCGVSLGPALDEYIAKS